MGETSAIQWTDSTWNPVTGCSKVSPGCAHCYAEALSLRYGWGKTEWTPANAAENVILHPDRLELPLRWRTPRRIFVNSMSDLFHELVPTKFIIDVFAVMAAAREHTFQVLTKRPERMAQVLSDAGFVDLVSTTMAQRAAQRGWCLDEVDEWPLPNVWLGTSVENQHWADVRIPWLLDTPAAVRFLSIEPLLGPIDLTVAGWNLCPGCGGTGERSGYYFAEDGMGPCRDCEARGTLNTPGIDWVIVGGESGPDARPMHPTWVQDLREQCRDADVAFFFKQWGEWVPEGACPYFAPDTAITLNLDGTTTPAARGPYPAGHRTLHRVGKHRAGRLLDGRTWDEYPASNGAAL